MNYDETKGLFTAARLATENRSEWKGLGEVCLYRVDPEGKVQLALGNRIDKDPQNQPGVSVFELIPEAQRHRFQEQFRLALATTSLQRFQCCVSEPGQRARVLEIHITPPVRGGETDSSVVAILDITDMDASLRQTRERNEALLSIFQTLPDTYFRVGPDGTILDCQTQKAADLYIPAEHFLGSRIQQLLPEHVIRLWEENLARLAKGESDVAYEYELDLPTGRQAFESRLVALPGSDDIIAVVRNITARRSAKAKLMESTHLLEEAQSIAHIGSFTFDVTADIARWTPETYRIFGLDPEHFVPTRESVGQCMHPDDRERYINQSNLWLSGVDAPIDLRILRPDGAERILSSRCKAIYDDDGQLTHLAGTVQDVTEQRLIERALKASEERFRHMIEMSWDMILLEDANTRVTYVNSAIKHILGYEPDEIIGKTSLNLVHDADLDYARDVLGGLLDDPAKPAVLELRLKHRDGGWRWVEVIGRNLLHEPGLSSIVVNIRDITDRKQAEAKLHAQELRFRALIENSADATALLTRHGVITYVSNNNAVVLGCAADDLLGLSLLELIVPESRDAVRRALAATLKRPGLPVAVDAVAQKGDGMRIRLEGHFTNLLDLEGVKAVVFNYRDVTEREHQREALECAHREADMFKRMVDLATQAIGTADLKARVLYQNPAMLRLLGVPSLEVARQYSYEDFYREEDLEYLRQEIIPGVLAEGHWIGEMTLKPLDRGPVPTIHNVYMVRDEAGQPVMISNVVTDISHQKAIEQALRISESRYRQLFEEALDGIAVADIRSGVLIDCNPALCRMVGRSREELIGRSQRILHAPEESVGRVSRTFEEHRSRDPGKIEVSQLITAAGQPVDVEIIANVIEFEGRTVMQGVFRDITEKKRAQEALFEEKERAQVTLYSIGDAVITTDDVCRVDYLNPVAEKLTGWALREAAGQPLDVIFRVHEDESREPLDNLVARCIQEGQVMDLTRNAVLRGRDGNEYDIRESAAPIRRADGRIQGAVLVFHDVSETRRLTRKMAYDAAHDPLTGLINRREFEVRLGNALERARKFGSQHALCYIDLDQFKIVNDSAGHEAGDLLLRQIKDLLSNSFREHDTLARLGGDEFGLLLDSCPLEHAVSIADAIIDRIREYRFVWRERGYRIGASVGLAPINSKTESVASLLSHADVACYTAKELGRNQVHVYHVKNGASVRRHVEILQAAGLRDALEKGRFRLYCQPIVPLHAGEQDEVCFEVLLRLQDETSNLVLPGAFIPAAERFDLMTDLDRWVMRTVFQRYHAICGESQTPIAINLSGNSLNDPSLLEYVKRQFDEFSLPPDKVCFEITETAAVSDLTRAGKVMHELQDLGCQLALDDFGSGLSSLRYLKTLPVNFLKIDGNFIENIDADSGDRAIVAAINQLAHRLGIHTIGEYAAKQTIVDTLHSLGVDYAQGFALGSPVPFDKAGIGLSFQEKSLAEQI